MTKQPLVLLLLSFWMAGTALGQSTRPTDTKAAFDRNAVDVLTKTFEAYQAAKTYQDRATLTILIKDRGQSQEQRFESKLVFERPNKAFYRWPGISIVSDGDQSQIHHPESNQFVRLTAPEQLSAAFFKDAMSGDVLNIVFSGLIGESPLETFLESMDELSHQGTIDLEDKPYHQIIYREGPDRTTLLIDAQTHLIRQLVVLPQRAELRNWELRIEFYDVTVNQPVNPELFAIADPEGARKVDRISSTRKDDYPDLGQSMPAVALDRFGTRKKATVSSLLGSRATFVMFWASWCQPCRHELPILEELYREYRAKGFEVVAINLDNKDTQSHVDQFVKEAKLTFPVLLDSKGQLSHAMMVLTIPMLLVLDSEGKIDQVHVGVCRDGGKEYRWIIERAVAGGKVDP